MTRVSKFVGWILLTALGQGLTLIAFAALAPGFTISAAPPGIIDTTSVVIAAILTALAGGALVGGLLTIAWLALYRLASRIWPLFFPLVVFFVTGVVVWLAARVAGFIGAGPITLTSIGLAALLALALTVVDTLLGVALSVNDDWAYDRLVTGTLRRIYHDHDHDHDAGPLAAAQLTADGKSDVPSAVAQQAAHQSPGMLFLEIDGLAEPILRRALEAGYMPTLRRWLEQGSHRLRGWETDLSSQTSASQAGILLGDNTGIPAFRWWDKPRGRLMVSSKVATAQRLEAALSTGNGLLVDGASRLNVFSGDAHDCLGVYSKLGDPAVSGPRSYFADFFAPYTLARTTGLFIADVVRERYQAWRQHRRDIRPRIQRGWRYAAVRAGTTTFLQEVSLFMLQADMFRGVPLVYTTFFAYDEVAHHSGIDRIDAFKTLRTLDRAIATLERAARSAPRPYQFVVLSDHGQSQGATFRQRHGETLGELVKRLIAEEYRVASVTFPHEDADNLGAALGEALRGDSRTQQLLRRATERRRQDGQIVIDRDRQAIEEMATREALGSDVVVLASGNLGLISFTHWPERMTYEELEAAFPGLLRDLVRHAGISFALVHSESEGGLVLGANGIRYLEHGYAVGDDPLAPFGPNAAGHLKRTDGFAEAPDILVMSQYDPATGEVAAFEELVGSHGGLGGPQTEPFILYPRGFPLDPERPIVGAAALHDALKAALGELAGAGKTASFSSVVGDR